MGPAEGQAQGQPLGGLGLPTRAMKLTMGLHTGEAACQNGEEAWAPGKPGFFACLCDHEQGTQFP